jgi:hypothetical protein
VPSETKQAEEQNKPAAQVPPAAVSAPAPKEAPAATGVKVEAPQNPPTEAAKPAKGVEKEFFKLREKVRSEKAEKEAAVTQRDQEIAALKARLDAFDKAKEAPASSPQSKAEALFENPEQFAAETARTAEEKAFERLKSEIAQAQERAQLEAKASEATNWLRTRSHLKQDPAMNDAIGEKIAERYGALADADPMAAGLRAYLDVCRDKGIAPDFSDYVSQAPVHQASSGITPSVAGKGEAPVIDSSNIKQYSESEVAKAYREGRYKGKVIQL